MKYKTVLGNYLGFWLLSLLYIMTSEQKWKFLKQDLSWHGSTVMQDIQNSQMHQLFAHIFKKTTWDTLQMLKSLHCGAQKLALSPLK